MRLYLALAICLVVSSAWAQVFQKPAAVLSPQKIEDFERTAEAPEFPDFEKQLPDKIDPRCAELIPQVQAEIEKYTSQFIRDKRIADERRTVVPADSYSENTVRLIQIARGKIAGRNYYLGDHPLLYRLHRVLGMCEEKTVDPVRALNEYAMAFRFTSMPERGWPETGRSEGQRNSVATTAGPQSTAAIQRQLQAEYLAMLVSFADADRISEEKDPTIKTEADRFRQIASEYGKSKNNYENSIKQIDVEQAKQAMNRPSDVAGARAKADAAKQTFNQVSAQAETVRNGAYAKYLTEKGKRDGALAFRMAMLTKYVERKNKEVDRILNRSSYYRGLGGETQEDRTSYNRFTGYALLMGLAHRFDPENLTYLSLLASEERSARNLDAALDLYQRYITIAEKQNPRPKEFAEHVLRTAGIHLDLANYLLAADAYEKYLSVENNPSPDSTLAVADIHFLRTGKFERAKELYLKYLAPLPALENETDLKKRNGQRYVLFRIRSNLAAIERRLSHEDAEVKELANAETIYRGMQQDLEKASTDVDALERKLFEIKNKLLTKEDEDLQREYYRLQRIELAQAKELMNYVRTQRDSLRIGSILERQALIATRNREYERSRAFYRELVLVGKGSEQTRARQNLGQIEETLNDGMLRQPIVSPDFER